MAFRFILNLLCDLEELLDLSVFETFFLPLKVVPPRPNPLLKVSEKEWGRV